MNDAMPLMAFAGETVSFQIAFLPPAVESVDELPGLRFEIGNEAAPFTVVSRVELVPCTVLAFDGHDHGDVRDKPGLYPDLLRPITGTVSPYPGQWGAVWIDVTAPAELDGRLTVEVAVRSEATATILHSVTVPIQVSPLRLPELDIVNTQWVHCDGLAEFYGDEVFSEDHWRAIANFIAKAAEMGVNSVLTPVWTPPLDTAVGGTRRPVQLVDIRDDHGEYKFDFAKLERWMAVCRASGITSLEIAHLFTQWGAEATPAIYVQTGPGLEHRFGWHTPATDPEYRRLLEALLPELRTVLDAAWGLDRVIFHISDEPHGPRMLESYRAARSVVDDLLAGCTVVDALSDLELYSSGAVPLPVVATDALDPFFEARVEHL